MKKYSLLITMLFLCSCSAMGTNVINNRYSAIGKPTIDVSKNLKYVGALDAKGYVHYDRMFASGGSKVDSYIFANDGDFLEEAIIIQVNKLTKTNFVWQPMNGKNFKKDEVEFIRNVMSASSLENDPYVNIYMKFLDEKGYSYGKSYCVVAYQKLLSSNIRFSVYYVIDYELLSNNTEVAQKEALDRSLNIFHTRH
ncbi:MAG: hypothetical protein AB7D07_02885 [Desulfovibrionaceae bacterium]